MIQSVDADQRDQLRLARFQRLAAEVFVPTVAAQSVDGDMRSQTQSLPLPIRSGLEPDGASGNATAREHRSRRCRMSEDREPVFEPAWPLVEARSVRSALTRGACEPVLKKEAPRHPRLIEWQADHSASRGHGTACLRQLEVTSTQSLAMPVLELTHQSVETFRKDRHRQTERLADLLGLQRAFSLAEA